MNFLREIWPNTRLDDFCKTWNSLDASCFMIWECRTWEVVVYNNQIIVYNSNNQSVSKPLLRFDSAITQARLYQNIYNQDTFVLLQWQLYFFNEESLELECLSLECQTISHQQLFFAFSRTKSMITIDDGEKKELIIKQHWTSKLWKDTFVWEEKEKISTAVLNVLGIDVIKLVDEINIEHFKVRGNEVLLEYQWVEIPILNDFPKWLKLNVKIHEMHGNIMIIINGKIFEFDTQKIELRALFQKSTYASHATEITQFFREIWHGDMFASWSDVCIVGKNTWDIQKFSCKDNENVNEIYKKIHWYQAVKIHHIGENDADYRVFFICKWEGNKWFLQNKEEYTLFEYDEQNGVLVELKKMKVSPGSTIELWASQKYRKPNPIINGGDMPQNFDYFTVYVDGKKKWGDIKIKKRRPNISLKEESVQYSPTFWLSSRGWVNRVYWAEKFLNSFDDEVYVYKNALYINNHWVLEPMETYYDTTSWKIFFMFPARHLWIKSDISRSIDAWKTVYKDRLHYGNWIALDGAEITIDGNEVAILKYPQRNSQVTPFVQAAE